jgi:hypothetical protein
MHAKRQRKLKDLDDIDANMEAAIARSKADWLGSSRIVPSSSCAPAYEVLEFPPHVSMWLGEGEEQRRQALALRALNLTRTPRRGGN